MHIVYIANGIPFQGDNGIPMMGWGLVRGMLSRGFKVTVVGLCGKSNKFCSQEFTKNLTKLGVKVKILEYQRPELKKKSIIGLLDRCSFAYLYPASVLVKKLTTILNKTQVDAIIAVHTEPLSVLLNASVDIPVIGIMGDPTSHPAHFRWKYLNTQKGVRHYVNRIWLALLSYCYDKHDVKMLKACDGRGVVAAQYVEWFESRGVDKCDYLPIPIYDEGLQISERYKDGFGNSKVKKIIMLGALNTTVTKAGLKYFSEKIYPVLKNELKYDYRVHIIGAGDWPNDIVKPNSNKIVIRGYVEDLTDDWLNTDILLVPTNIELGVRARILTAFSKGMCVVSHVANVKGIPELRHGHNCMLGSDSHELVECMNKIFSDAVYAENISRNSRATYENVFSEKSASSNIIDKVMSVLR
jgi:glycosyltransferase involved in cell wall biosynthesis